MSHLVLVGLMGVGKTTVGRRCAERLGRPFVDTDDLVQAAAGVSVPELFAAEGEAGFRAREVAAVADAVASPEPLVIACGGGAVLDPVNRRALRDGGFVVWLRAAPEELATRVGDPADRPLLAGRPPLVTLGRLTLQRDPAYAAAAHAEVDTGERTVDAVTEAVLRAYAEAEA